MKLYVYENPESAVSDRWHCGGGVVIITDRDPEQVWAEANPAGAVEHWDVKPSKLGEPNYVCEANSSAERLFVFPDAGCC